ncbi:MAG TPA: kelch repeat-containing protein [Candidatus Sulfotelmatobacter sp.]
MGTWQALKNAPSFGASTMLLLTDGTIMCQESGGKNWWRLSPDTTGNYVNGTWSPLAPMKNSRLYFASAVLRDGRVFVAGGEYSDGGGDLDAAEIYDPLLNLWTSLSVPPGWTEIGDAPCCVLPDGRLLLGSIQNSTTAIYDPDLNTWTAGANKDDSSSEETWTLLPDETVLAVECSNHPNVEKYVAPAEKWVKAASTPVDLVQASSIEIGPAILRPDGSVFAIGATGRTAIYTPPPLADQQGSWITGPSFPADAHGNLMQAKDAPACLLPNGNVLCVAAPAGEGGDFPGPTQFFEFDGAALNQVSIPPNAGGPPYVGRMLLLPSGQVLFASGGADIEVYTPSGSPDPAWRPQILSVPFSIRAGQSYNLQGRQLNGLSQANSYGDDASMATNYPLVKLTTADGVVHFCRTFDHSTMGVATGTTTQSTFFKVPFGVRNGPAEICVIANGISSPCVPVYVWPFRLHVPITGAMVNRLIGSLADGPLWVLTDHGPVPVDPWGPEIAAKAKQAWATIIEGVRNLQQLGHQIENGQVAMAGKKAEKLQISPSGQRRRKHRKAA